jgi:multisubunit Na+/H+ antiporter MnhE subunit
VVWLAWWILLSALYLLLSDSVAPQELAVGAAAAAIGATGAVLVRQQRRLRLRPRLRHFRAAPGALLRSFTDLAPLAVKLVRGRGGELVEVPFETGGDEREAATRRAFTEAIGSLAPATIVVEVDERRGVTVEHRL